MSKVLTDFKGKRLNSKYLKTKLTIKNNGII